MQIPSLEYVSRHTLSYLFFSHFFFKEFPMLIQNTSSIEYDKILEYLKVSDVEASSLIFKLVAIMDAVNRPKEALMFINNLLESCFEKSLNEKGYVLLEFVFYFSNRTNFTELNIAYYMQVQNQLRALLADRISVLQKFAVSTQKKYEAIFGVVKYFEEHFIYTQSDLKLLRVLILAMNFDKSQIHILRMASDEAILAIAFNNPQITMGLYNLENRLAKTRCRLLIQEAFQGIKMTAALFKSFAGLDLNYYVMKFNHSSKTKRTFRYLCLRSHIFAVVSKSKMEKLSKARSRKGICRLIRFG